MPQAHIEHGCLLQVGGEIIPVYGDDEAGWGFEAGELAGLPALFRYRTLPELFFALVNLQHASEGSA